MELFESNRGLESCINSLVAVYQSRHSRKHWYGHVVVGLGIGCVLVTETRRPIGLTASELLVVHFRHGRMLTDVFTWSERHARWYIKRSVNRNT